MIGKLFDEVIDSTMLSAGRLVNLGHYALQCSTLMGDMVEFGCHTGRTAAYLAALVKNKPLWLYDSFEGLPDRTAQDSGARPQFQRGVLAVSHGEVLARFERLHLRKPHIHKAWFQAVTPDELPPQICFAHLDGDFYESILASLKLVYPRLVRGAACIVDDYGWDGLPGVKLAVDAYMADKPERVCQLTTNANPAEEAHSLIVKL